jgi:hypothetical protein
MLNMPELILATRSGAVTGTLTYVKTTAGETHPIMAGLPTSFTFDASSNAGACKAGLGITVLATQTFTTASDAVCVRDYGSGRVVYFNHTGHYSPYAAFSDSNVAQLLAQSVAWACQ